MSVLSEKLRELRAERGITVREFAEQIGKTAGYVSQIEGRSEIPSPELICKIAAVYGVSPEGLLELAKRSQLERTERDIDSRHASALALFRKEKKRS